MRRVPIRGAWCGAAALAAAAVGGTLLLRPDTRLMGEDLAAVRRDALAMFPRGSRVADAQRQLAAMRFHCTAIDHKLANVTSASLTCDSNGRSFPHAPGLNVTVLGRWGAVADIEVWNSFGDARPALAETASR